MCQEIVKKGSYRKVKPIILACEKFINEIHVVFYVS
jgi:hypothetical protein